jgi:hypothetical protein
MSNNKSEYRHRNGGRLEGRALAVRVAQEVNGMMVAQAYVTAKSAGFRLQINKNDGVPRQGGAQADGERVMVDVVSGFVAKSWAAG